jgi:hypothetical protein
VQDDVVTHLPSDWGRGGYKHVKDNRLHPRRDGALSRWNETETFMYRVKDAMDALFAALPASAPWTPLADHDFLWQYHSSVHLYLGVEPGAEVEDPEPLRINA